MFVVGTLKKEQEDTKQEIGSGERISLAPWHITCAPDNHLGNNAHFTIHRLPDLIGYYHFASKRVLLFTRDGKPHAVRLPSAAHVSCCSVL